MLEPRRSRYRFVHPENQTLADWVRRYFHVDPSTCRRITITINHDDVVTADIEMLVELDVFENWPTMEPDE